MKKMLLTLDLRLFITAAAYQQQSDQEIWQDIDVWFANVSDSQYAMLGQPSQVLPAHGLTRHEIYINESWYRNVIDPQLTQEQLNIEDIFVVESFTLDSAGCFVAWEIHFRYLLDLSGPVLAHPDDPDHRIACSICELMQTHHMLTVTYLD